VTDGRTDRHGIVLISVANDSKAQTTSRAEFQSPVHIGIQVITRGVKPTLRSYLYVPSAQVECKWISFTCERTYVLNGSSQRPSDGSSGPLLE
jgi:hypothetical protein